MGKGDKKSRKGKIFAGSFGVRRKKKKGKTVKTEVPVQTGKIVKPRKTKAANS
ncbi:MAG: 30S ribosomal protein THX [Bacteroidales bacterium]